MFSLCFFFSLCRGYPVDRDTGKWSAAAWACAEGRTAVVQLLTTHCSVPLVDAILFAVRGCSRVKIPKEKEKRKEKKEEV